MGRVLGMVVCNNMRSHKSKYAQHARVLVYTHQRQQGAAVSSMLRQVSFAFGLLGAIWEHQHRVKAYVVIREKGEGMGGENRR